MGRRLGVGVYYQRLIENPREVIPAVFSFSAWRRLGYSLSLWMGNNSTCAVSSSIQVQVLYTCLGLCFVIDWLRCALCMSFAVYIFMLYFIFNFTSSSWSSLRCASGMSFALYIFFYIFYFTSSSSSSFLYSAISWEILRANLYYYILTGYPYTSIKNNKNLSFYLHIYVFRLSCVFVFLDIFILQ